MSKPLRRGMRLPVMIYALALVCGLALTLGFVRFHSIHGEFLDANFDAVHGARTLLKARHFLGQAEERLNAAASDGERRARLVATAVEALDLAESYGAEGRDADPRGRAELKARTRALRDSVARLQVGGSGAAAQIGAAAEAIHRLAGEYESAELERWGNLSSLNAELAERMDQMRLFVASIAIGFLLLMGFLGWALWRARRADLALRQAIADIEAIQQTTLDASPVGIVYIDHMQARILLANRHMAEIFGYAPEEMPNVPIADLYPDATAQAAFSASLAADSGVVLRRETLMRRRGGEIFWCAMTGKAIDASGPSRRVVWTCEDISGRKESERQLLAARERAEAASRAKSDFLANVSHEIRTPFTGILGVLELLAATPLAAGQARYLAMAQHSTQQLLAIVNDLLDISRIEAGKLAVDAVDFDARQLFDDIVPMHETTAVGKGLAFSYRFDGEASCEIVGDPIRIRQIVDNLLSNAVKFTAHGRVGLQVRCTGIAADRRRLRVEVSDTGIGIADDKKTLIFDTFTQADTATTRRFGGTGLGLSICRKLARLMDADIGVDSSVGAGSRFWLQLDLPVARAALSPPQREADAAVQQLAGKRVLVVDDAELNRLVMIESLAETGCELRGAVDGRAAIELAASWKPDLILMDCQMPELDGYSATREIRRREADGRRIPILAITAHALPGNREKCLAAGMDDFLVKPVSRRQLVARIAFWLDAASEPAMARSDPAYPQFEGRVLLVDNDATIREACRGMLEAMGCAVVTAASGEQAIEALDAGDFDLVLMDCHMPGMDGWEATRRWRASEVGRPRTAIIAMTGTVAANDLHRCRDAGMDDFLAKPFVGAGLIALLGRWLGPAARAKE